VSIACGGYETIEGEPTYPTNR